MKVHQLVPTFRRGDATSQAALDFRGLLAEAGLQGLIHSLDAHFDKEVRPVSELSVAPEDWALYHHGIASPLSGYLAHLPCRRGVVFHNVTPARFYEGASLAEPLVSGRAQLASLAHAVELGLGVSEHNVAELEVAGFSRTAHVPLPLPAERFAEAEADAELLRRLRAPAGPLLLSVGRMVPHKKLEDVLALHRQLSRLDPRARLALVGGYDAGSRYFRQLTRALRRTPNVTLLGRLSHPQLVAAYHAADLFVSMSEHEGLGVPLVEAMHAQVPVLAFAAGAVAQTLGGAGVAFTQKDFRLLAELSAELLGNAALRRRVLAGQTLRAKAFSPSAVRRRLLLALGASERRASQRTLPGYGQTGRRKYGTLRAD